MRNFPATFCRQGIRSMLLFVLFATSASVVYANPVIQWTLQNVALSFVSSTGSVGTVTLSGTFDTGPCCIASNLTAVETVNSTVYTYNFTGGGYGGSSPFASELFWQVNSLHPPTCAFPLSPCPLYSYGITDLILQPIPQSLPGPGSVLASFHDDDFQVFAGIWIGSGAITGDVLIPDAVPEPPFWIPLWTVTAIVLARLSIKRMRRAADTRV